MPRATRSAAAAAAAPAKPPTRAVNAPAAPAKPSTRAAKARELSSDLSDLSESDASDGGDADMTVTAKTSVSVSTPMDDGDDFAMMLASLAKGGAVPDAPDGVEPVMRDDENDTDGDGKGTKRTRRRKVEKAPAKAKVKSTENELSKQNLLSALVRNETHAQKRRGRDELTEMAARIADIEDNDELSAPGPSQASVTTTGGEVQLDALGNTAFSPSRNGKLKRGEIQHGLRLAQNAHYLGEGVKDDDFERLDAMLVEGAGVEDDDGLAEDEAVLQAEAEAARILELRGFWASAPTFAPPTLWPAGTERPVALLVHRALAVGLATPRVFRCDVLQPSVALDFIDALVCLAWVVSLLLHPRTSQTLCDGLQPLADLLLRTIASDFPRMVDEAKWPLSADRIIDCLRTLGAKPELLIPATAPEPQQPGSTQSSPIRAMPSRQRGYTPLDHLTGPTPTQLTDAMEDMAVDEPTSSPGDVDTAPRSGAVERLLSLITRCGQLGLVTSATARATVPVLVRLSIDPTSSPLCLGIDSAVEALLLHTARDEPQALLGIAHAVVLALADMPRQVQAAVVIALPGRTARLRTFRRWVAWALLVGADKLVPITEFDTLPPRRTLYRQLGWNVAKDRFEKPSASSPFDPSADLDPNILAHSSILLQYALSDMRPYIAIRLDTPDQIVRERVILVRELEMVRQGVAALPTWIKDASVLSGKPERAEVKLKLDKLDTAIAVQLAFDRAARERRVAALAS